MDENQKPGTMNQKPDFIDFIKLKKATTAHKPDSVIPQNLRLSGRAAINLCGLPGH
jgi:hypothetical protein